MSGTTHKPVWLAAAVALLWIGAALAAVLYWKSLNTENRSPIPPHLSAVAERRDLEELLLIPAEVLPAFTVELKSEVPGKIRDVHVEPGRTVSRGEVLITIDDTELLTEKTSAETEIAGAQIEEQRLRANYERIRLLHSRNLLSNEEHENARADALLAANRLAQARARLRAVEDRLSKTRIFAPADGVVLTVDVIPGQVVSGAANVNAGTLLLTMADISRLIVKTHLNQLDVQKLRPGDDLKIHLPGGTQAGRARVRFIAPVATVVAGVKGFALEAEVIEKNDLLRPGMNVILQARVGTAAGALAVPVAAVFRQDDGRRYVYVRQGREGTHKRFVEVGLVGSQFAQILQGLDEGEEVLLVPPPLNPSSRG